MPSKSKLEKALEDGVCVLNDAQREIVMAQFSDYKRNKARIAVIEDTLRLRQSSAVSTSGLNAQRSELVSEKVQLMEVNGRIAARLFDQLSDRR